MFRTDDDKSIRWIPNDTRVKELWAKDKIFCLYGK